MTGRQILAAKPGGFLFVPSTRRDVAGRRAGWLVDDASSQFGRFGVVSDERTGRPVLFPMDARGAIDVGVDHDGPGLAILYQEVPLVKSGTDDPIAGNRGGNRAGLITDGIINPGFVLQYQELPLGIQYQELPLRTGAGTDAGGLGTFSEDLIRQLPLVVIFVVSGVATAWLTRTLFKGRR